MTGVTHSLDPLNLRRDLAAYPTGVVAVCALIDGRPVGMAVNSFTSISLEPPIVSVSVARTSTTWPRLARSQRLGLSVLGADQEALCRRLSSRDGDRFADASWSTREGGALFLDGAALWMECSVASVVEGGDHEIILLDVVASEMFPEVHPLLFHRSQLRPVEPR